MRGGLFLQQQGIISGAAAAYDPGMMTFNGTDGYYSKAAFSASGNATTIIFRFNSASFSGGASRTIFSSPNGRAYANIRPNDEADPTRHDKMNVGFYNASGSLRFRAFSKSALSDGNDHLCFASFDATAGTGIMYVDGVDEVDTGHALYVAPAGGTLPTAEGIIEVAAASGVALFTGDIGYFGYRDAYLTNPTDFYHPTNGLQELDESGWTEWGAQPLFWNQYGTMTDNKGSAGNMTANGTITGPA